MYYYHALPLLPLMFQHHRGGTCPSKPTKCKARQLNISTYFLSKKLNAVTCNLTMLTTKSSWCFQSALLVWYCMLSDISKWFEPRSISSSYCVIICAVLKRTVVAYTDQSLSTDQPYNIIDWQTNTIHLTLKMTSEVLETTTNSHQQQFFSELLSPRGSHKMNYDCFIFKTISTVKIKVNVSPCQQTEPLWCPGMWFQHVWCSSRSCRPAREEENSRKENIPCELCKVSETKLTVVVSSIFTIRVG